MESRILLSAVELELFDRFLAGPRTAAEIATAVGSDRRATEILLNALTAMEVLALENGVYAVHEDVAAFLLPDSASNVTDPIRHMGRLWESWSGLTQTVKSGHAGSSRWTEAARLGLARAMQWQAREPAARLAALLEGSPMSRMVDLGGGPGAYCIAMAERVPQLHAVLCDRDDQALQLATLGIRAAGLQDRIEVSLRDVLIDDIGTDYDLALLSSFVCTCSEAQNRHLLRKVKDSLRAGGRVLVRDYMLDDTGAAPAAAALFSVSMLVATPDGRVYTRAEVRQWLEDAGFEGVHWIPMDDMQVMIGQKREG
jgi:predicted O-methyltransferase YrrM